MKNLLESIQKRFRAVEKTANAARNLAGDGSRIGVDITPQGATIRWLGGGGDTAIVEPTGPASGGVRPGKLWRRDGSTWVDTGIVVDILDL